MINTILALALNIALFYLVSKGQKAFKTTERIINGRKSAENRYRWSNGRFSKVKTYADLNRELEGGEYCG